MQRSFVCALWSSCFTFFLTAVAGPSPSWAGEPRHDTQARTIVEEELTRAERALHPKAAVVVVLDAPTGRIVAMAGRRDGRAAPDLARDGTWVTGSTLKSFTVAAALEARVMTPETVVDCAPRSYPQGELHDWKVFGQMPVHEALVVSSNVGASRVLDALGLERLVASHRALHLFDPPGTWPEVADPASLDAAKYAAGELATTSPLRLAAAYAALFDEGRYHAPSALGDAMAEVVYGRGTVTAMLAMLESAVAGPLGTGRAAAVEGHRVAGKTGTADLAEVVRPQKAGSEAAQGTWATFVGSVLDVAPKLVILVGFEGVKDGTGGQTAAPVFSRIAARLFPDHRE